MHTHPDSALKFRFVLCVWPQSRFILLTKTPSFFSQLLFLISLNVWEMVAQTNDELPKWITKQKASMLLLDSYFIDFNLVGFFNSRKRRWSLIPFWRKLLEGDWSMMSSLHWSVFIALSVMICNHWFICFKFVSSLLWRAPLSVIINLKSVLICHQTFRSPKNNTDRRRHFFQQS